MHRNYPARPIKVNPWDYSIFRPRVGECPAEMVNQLALNECDLDSVRIMKDEDSVIAAYRISNIDSVTYEIAHLYVTKSYRGKGIGRWLLAHAVGVIETKGGRHVRVNNPVPSWVMNFGFNKVNSEFCEYVMTQE